LPDLQPTIIIGVFGMYLLNSGTHLSFIFALCIENQKRDWLVGFMVFNSTFNSISVISWRSVLLVEETRVPGENHQLVAWP
jgi:hypothetical protein